MFSVSMRMVYLQVSESLVGLERCTNTWTVHSQRTALPVGLSEARPVASSEFRSGGVEVGEGKGCVLVNRSLC